MVLNKYVKILLISVVILIMGVKDACGQHLEAALSHYSADEGMSSNTISDIEIDGYGFIWIASWNGLSRFDGYHFNNYHTGNTSGIPLLHNRIERIYFDHSQNVWMAMYDGRVFVLNRHTDQIINPLIGVKDYENIKTRRHLFVDSNGSVYAIMHHVGIFILQLENNRILRKHIPIPNGMTAYAITERKKGELWVGTNKGIYRLNVEKKELQQTALVEEEVVTSLFTRDNTVYAGTQSGKIISFNHPSETHVLAELQIPISSLFVDSKHLVWFSQDAQGISRLNQETGNVKSFTQKVMVPQFDVKGADVKEAGGIVWISMNHGGFGYYNRETDEVEYFHNDPSNSWNLSNTVHAFAPLPEGVIWESTSRRGLEKLEILKNTIVRKKLFAEGIGFTNEIRAFYYDKSRGVMLIGNKANALAIFNKYGNRTDITTDDKGQPLGRIYGISMDSKGNYWICCKGNGVFKMTPHGNGYSFTHFIHQDNNSNSLNNNNAYYALEDKYGNIWVATYGGGINIIVPQPNGTYRILNGDNTLTNYPSDTYRKIRTIAIDKKGNVWAGTTDGLLSMSYKQNRFIINILKNCNDPNFMIGSNDIVCMGCDKYGSMWIGTNGGGLCHTIGTDENGNWMYENFGSRNGLPSDEIKALTFDQKGHVWFSTDRVICSFDTERRIFSTFTLQDGVDDTMCSECGAIALPNGDILFGTIDGYYFIDHRKLSSTKGALLKLQITDFLINDAIVTPRWNDDFDYYIPESKSVELPNHNSVFAFRFASLNYQLQHRVHYQYMLEGYETEWQNADKTRTVTYSGLPTGTYRFKVKAFLMEAPENYDMRTIEVKVPPFWLFSDIAVWIYLIIAVISILAFIYWQQEKLKQQQLQANISGKQEAATNSQSDLDFMKQQTGWLQDHYSDINLRYEDLIAQSALGRNDYYNQLLAITGMSPKEFITDFRLNKAKELLDGPDDMSIAEVAQRTGFADPVYFTRSFKLKMGLTPLRYREQKKRQSVK